MGIGQTSPTITVILFYLVCCLSCAFVTGKKVFITIGMFIIASVLTQYIVTGWITDFIGLKHIMYFFVLWALSVIVMQIDILIDCMRINPNTMRISAINALGGSIAASIAVLVFDIIVLVVPILKPLKMFLMIVPILGPALAQLFDALILTQFNLIFGMGVARNVALAQACAPAAPAPPA